MSPRVADGRRTAKFTQICASRNDLFALDEEGDIHQYNFTAKAWEQLAVGRSAEGPDRAERGRRR